MATAPKRGGRDFDLPLSILSQNKPLHLPAASALRSLGPPQVNGGVPHSPRHRLES
jgi:hypothetical protein